MTTDTIQIHGTIHTFAHADTTRSAVAAVQTEHPTWDGSGAWDAHRFLVDSDTLASVGMEAALCAAFDASGEGDASDIEIETIDAPTSVRAHVMHDPRLVASVRALLVRGVSVYRVADDIGVSVATVRRIARM